MLHLFDQKKDKKERMKLNAFIQQGSIKLIQNDSKDIYHVKNSNHH